MATSTMKCDACGASTTEDSPRAALEWDMAHDVICPMVLADPTLTPAPAAPHGAPVRPSLVERVAADHTPITWDWEKRMWVCPCRGWASDVQIEGFEHLIEATLTAARSQFRAAIDTRAGDAAAAARDAAATGDTERRDRYAGQRAGLAIAAGIVGGAS